MANTFEIIGKLSIGKESDKFKPYNSDTSPSNWTYNKLLFNVQSGENRHLLSSGGAYKANGKGIIKTFTKGEVDPTTHVRTKGENIEVEWKNRSNPEILSTVAEFKKFVVDLEVYGRRKDLKEALNKQKKGNLTEEELVELGVTDIEKAVEDSEKRRKEFLSEYDFAEYLHKLVSSEKIKGKLFKIQGEITYSSYNGTIYKNLVPTRVYLVTDEQESSTGQITLYYNKESLDSGSFKDNKRHYINGFVRNYDGNAKDVLPFPVQLVVDGSKEENQKVVAFAKLMEKQFTVKDNSWKEFGVKVKLLDGAQKVEIDEEMLTDFQKEMLELEMTTLDEIRKEIGGDLYGDKVEEMVIINVAKGFTKGRKDTVFVNSDFVLKAAPAKQPSSKVEEIDELGDLDDLDIL